MEKIKTKFSVLLGQESFPIYLVVRDTDNADFKYDLWCEHEIYAVKWWDIYTESIVDYEKGELK